MSDTIKYADLLAMYNKLQARPRKRYFLDADTARSLPADELGLLDVFILPRAFEAMLPRKWPRRMFSPPYRKPAIRARWVETPKGIYEIDTPKGLFE